MLPSGKRRRKKAARRDTARSRLFQDIVGKSALPHFDSKLTLMLGNRS
jgi:hypothetical protein